MLFGKFLEFRASFLSSDVAVSLCFTFDINKLDGQYRGRCFAPKILVHLDHINRGIASTASHQLSFSSLFIPAVHAVIYERHVVETETRNNALSVRPVQAEATVEKTCSLTLREGGRQL
jgi:hypothetical protein